MEEGETMITAHQAAQLKAAQALYEAREKLISVQSNIALDSDQIRSIGKICNLVDFLFASFVPN